jgi:hypothetical protein
MHWLRTISVGLALCLVAAALAGCSDPYAGRMQVSGAVKLEGQPLDRGSIQFVALEEQSDTQRAGATIKDGAFTIPRKDGLKPGKYMVRITSGDGKTIDNPEEAAGPGGSSNIVSVDRIPEDWNVNSKQQVEVKANETNHFDFPIPNLNPRLKQKR